MGVRMSLARLGRLPSETDPVAVELQEAVAMIEKQLILMNDYMALMANTDSPPERDKLDE